MNGPLIPPVRGAMLVQAMIWAQARTAGGPAQKLAAGVGILNKYLGENPVRKTDWERSSRFSPEIVVARSCLNRADLETVGTYFERVAEPDQLKEIYVRLLTPHFAAGRIDPSVICPKLPDHDLGMPKAPGQGLMISRNPISCAQFEAFRGQTEVEQSDSFPDFTGKETPVTRLPLSYAKEFAKWQGMGLPTEQELLLAQRSLGIEFNADPAYDEWTGSEEGFYPLLVSWALPVESYRGYPEVVGDCAKITFRVVEQTKG